MSARAYPLQWPKGWPRSTSREDGKRFKGATLSSALSGLKREIELLGGKNLVLSSNYTLGSENPKDNGVVAYFVKGQTQIAIPCDRWDKVQYNVRAIALTIEAMRGMERWGAKHMIEAMFSGFTALPERTGPSCWDVLGLKPEPLPTEAQIMAAWRQKSQAAHPDTGGSHEKMVELNNAKDIALQTIK